MQRLALFVGAIVFAVAIAASYLSAQLISGFVENRTVAELSSALTDEGHDWVRLRTDGLIVYVSGAAPDEVSRFKAMKTITNIVRNNRVRDELTVAEPDSLHTPKYSLELLRNDDGISLIGLIPEATGRTHVLDMIADAARGSQVTDMLETSDYAEPEGWPEAVDFALSSLATLPRSKISVTQKRVVITAITESQQEKAGIEEALEASRPEAVALELHITAPRPVIAPFSLRFVIDAEGAHFDSCSADTAKARDSILAAAATAGLPAGQDCRIGLGAPSPSWAEAVGLSIRALAELGGGNLTFSNADISLIATEETPQAEFDRIVNNLENALPDVFSVHAVLPPKTATANGAADTKVQEYLAIKSPEGLLQLRGRVRDTRTKTSIGNYARAKFGGDNVHDTTRIEPSLPDGWTKRVLAGLESLDKLHSGMLQIDGKSLELRGKSSSPEARTEITQILGEKLGEASHFVINVTYDETLNRQVQLPTPEECVERINAILKEKQIVFAPSSTRIEGDALAIVERIAEAMEDCSEVPMEIGGHTDSQGRESMNQTLSQARAEAVLDTLLSLEVLTTFLSAKGYGESQPIADNGTEEGRALNRRIEFRLINPDPSANAPSGDSQDQNTSAGTPAAEDETATEESDSSQSTNETETTTEATDGQN